MSETPTLPNILASLFGSDDNGILRSSLESIMTGSTPNNRIFSPYADVINTETTFMVFIDIPGLQTSDIKVDFFNNQLSVSGVRKPPTDDEPLRRECLYGEFTKKIPLPHSVTNQKNVKVTYKNGVLKITVDKQSEEGNRFTASINETD